MALGLPTPERGPFYNEIQEAAQKVRAQHKVQRFVFKTWCVIITLAFILAFAWLLLAPSLLSAAFSALVFEVYFLNIFHTRHHKGGNLYEQPALDLLTAPLYDFIERTWGYRPEAWWHNHQLLHHIETNALESDPDVPASYPAIRSSPLQPRLWFHFLQTFYFVLWLPFSVARFPVENAVKHGGSCIFFGMWLFLMFILPLSLHGASGLAYSLLVLGMTGVNLTYKFAVSHTHPDLGRSDLHGMGEEAGKDIDRWMSSQVEESTSWGGYWATLIFGGINMQIEHHLGPALEPPLYHFWAPEVRRICAKYGVRYTFEPSLFHAAFKFHARLWRMGLAEQVLGERTL